MENKEIKVLPLIYDLLLWYAPKIAKYPKSYKFTIGRRITDGMLNILESVIEAKFSSKKKAHFLRWLCREYENFYFFKGFMFHNVVVGASGIFYYGLYP